MRAAFRIKFGLLLMTVLLVQGCGGGGEGSVGASNFGALPDSTRNIPVDSTSNTATGVIEANFVQVATSSISLLNNVAADSTAGRSDKTANLTLANVLLGMLFDVEAFKSAATPSCGDGTILDGSSANSYLITITNCQISGAAITGSVNIDNYVVALGTPQKITFAPEWSVSAEINISSLEFQLNNKKFNYTGILAFAASYRTENSNGNELKITLSSTPSLTVLEEIEAIANGTPTIFRDDIQNNFSLTTIYNPNDLEHSLIMNGDISSRVTANPVSIQTETPFSWSNNEDNPYTGKMTIFDTTSSSQVIITANTSAEVDIAYDNNGDGLIESTDTFNWPINTN